MSRFPGGRLALLRVGHLARRRYGGDLDSEGVLLLLRPRAQGTCIGSAFLRHLDGSRVQLRVRRVSRASPPSWSSVECASVLLRLVGHGRQLSVLGCSAGGGRPLAFVRFSMVGGTELLGTLGRCGAGHVACFSHPG